MPWVSELAAMVLLRASCQRGVLFLPGKEAARPCLPVSGLLVLFDGTRLGYFLPCRE